MKDYTTILERALVLGKERHPGAPSQHHAAFANSVAYAVTRMSGGYGGPSMREHWASRVVASTFGGQSCSFEQAAELLDECCYGELTLQHALMLDLEYCFDDAPGEQEAAREMLAKANT
jgi:hypothetical protein